MEKRKRDQVIKQQKEEAEQKKSDFEVELQKRHQKLDEVRNLAFTYLGKLRVKKVAVVIGHNCYA